MGEEEWLKTNTKNPLSCRMIAVVYSSPLHFYTRPSYKHTLTSGTQRLSTAYTIISGQKDKKKELNPIKDNTWRGTTISKKIVLNSRALKCLSQGATRSGLLCKRLQVMSIG